MPGRRKRWEAMLAVAALLSLPGGALAHDDRPTGWIIFHAGAEGRQRLVRKNVLAGAQRDLTPRAQGLGNPSGARAGGRVAFQRAGDIWALDLKTRSTANLTRSEPYDGCPWMFPDGSRIVFDGIRAGRSDIFLMAGDGTNVRQLTRGPGNHACPAVSPDGRMVAFVSDRDGQMEIYLLDLITGVERRLTDDPEADMDPAFSPDGRRIAFTSDRRGKFEIYEMNLDGTGLRRLTEARSRRRSWRRGRGSRRRPVPAPRRPRRRGRSPARSAWLRRCVPPCRRTPSSTSSRGRATARRWR